MKKKEARCISSAGCNRVRNERGEGLLMSENFGSMYECVDIYNNNGYYQSHLNAQAQRTIDAFVKEFQHKTVDVIKHETILSASIAGTSVNVDGQSIEKYFNDDVKILEYCLARINEIEAINRFSPTPSAFGCILSFIDFFAQAVYDTTIVGDSFCNFCDDYIRQLRCKQVKRTVSSTSKRTQKENTNTWGEVLYKLVRCGLVHSMNSIDNKEPGQDEVEVRVTHSHLEGDDVKIINFKDANGVPCSVLDTSFNAVVITINAFDLIKAVRDSILRACLNSSAMGNIKKHFSIHPPLMAVVECNNQGKI